MSTAPVYEIDHARFWADPYPDLARMRAGTPIAFVPQLNATLFTRRDAIFECEKNIAVFSSEQPGGLMTALMGENMMRKDGEAHLAERKQMFPAVSPRTVRDRWTAQFREDAQRILDQLAPRGAADLTVDYAMPVSANALRALTGLTSMTPAELDGSSQAMIDGCANYIGDPAVEKRCNRATALIDAHIDRAVPLKEAAPDHSILSVLMQAGQPLSQIRANIKLAISGGQNEPRDAIAGAAWALLSHPEQLALVKKGEVGWDRVFAEYVRWMSPIGMSPRRVARAFEYEGVRFAPEERVFFMFGAANRDPAHFDAPDRFDITRDASAHIAFGAGPHFCAGAWASKALVAEVALPMLFARLKGLRLNGAAKIGGWAFRGPLNAPVAWDAG
ncbi:cytochrome P450 [Pikeienuella piscinae]|uniref:Cytochrome P450 n=1 Tax=Pikeienuella piscinae TaxID=2748098 RepID=A0A7L5BVC2_9RHOB|nr:cytochrome P450 [Pikeienuella piscinae]QIE55682.1 cytochrome P450 [Pikeienuella piscinae]